MAGPYNKAYNQLVLQSSAFGQMSPTMVARRKEQRRQEKDKLEKAAAKAYEPAPKTFTSAPKTSTSAPKTSTTAAKTFQPASNTPDPAILARVLKSSKSNYWRLSAESQALLKKYCDHIPQRAPIYKPTGRRPISMELAKQKKLPDVKRFGDKYIDLWGQRYGHMKMEDRKYLDSFLKD